MTNRITKIDALKTIYYSEFIISNFSVEQFVEYGMKHRNAVKLTLDLLDYSRLLIEVNEKREQIRNDVEKYFNK